MGTNSDIRQQIDQERAVAWERARPTLLLFGALMATLAIASVVLFAMMGASWMGWFLAGAVCGAAAVIASNQVDIVAGVSERVAGLDVEGSIARSLRRIPGSTVFHDMPLERGNIDQIVVCPDGVLAVETKWTTKKINFDQPNGSSQLRKGLAQAHESAKKLQTVLNFGAEWKLEVEVQPCLVLAGLRVADVPGGIRVIDGVYVLVGRQDKEWATLFQSKRLDASQLEALTEGLAEMHRIRKAA